ncbi:hypothetical protein [Cryobacterium sp. Y50]|uniref:hypothetical protein n=1 Tax=Cryobacterium sp. Y50 TaxID=2048286 RepID=UPI000CE3B9C5|nr:hypothetical protein [Cryobacterium sp. Y50]
MPDLGFSSELKALRPAFAVVGFACITMVVASVVFWPDMAESLVTRGANARHGESVVQRWFAVAAFPFFLVLFAALLGAAPLLDRKLRKVLSQDAPANSRNAVRVLGYLLAGVAVAMAMAMTISHFGLLSAFAGNNFPLEEAMAASLGLIVILLGIAFPLARPEDESLPPFLRRLLEAVGPGYRPAAILMVLIGVASITLAFVSAWTALVVASAGTITLILGVYTIALLRVRRHDA